MMSLIEMTLEGAVIIAVIILIRSQTMHRLPKQTFLLLWAVALIRLLVPVRIASPASIYSVTPGLTEFRRSGILTPELTAQTVAVSTDKAAFTVSPWMIIWLTGGVLLAFAILICHIKNRQIYRTSLPVEDPWISHWMECHRLRRPVFVRFSDQIEAPLTYGVLWPVILLPAKTDWSDETLLGFVLAHEMSHIRRFDALSKWFLAAVLCLHWFNPLVWVMYILANRDLELSCDESVVHMYGLKSRSDYALALVNMEEQRSAFTPLANCFCRSALKERITAIMKSPKKSIASLAVAAALIGTTIIVFATSAPADHTPSQETQSSAVMEIVEEAVAEGGNLQSPSYTKAQYDDLMKDIKLEGYEEMSIAEFNSRIYALLSSENEERRILFEQILAYLPEDDPEAAYLCNTVQASLEEYTARMEEVYSGKQNDPEFYGSAYRELKEDVYGDEVVTESRRVSYEFTYRILDQDKLTVRERDEFLQNIVRVMQNNADKSTSDTFTKDAFEKMLTSTGEKATTGKISFTGGTVMDIESY